MNKKLYVYGVWNLNGTKKPSKPLTVGTLRKIAGGNDINGYNQWKQKYVNESKETATDFLDMMKDRICELAGTVYKREYECTSYILR